MADQPSADPTTPELRERVGDLDPDEITQLLNSCRDRLAHGLATVFAQHMSDASEDLLGMADRATSLEQQQLYFSAMNLLEKQGQQLLQQFHRAYVASFDASVAALRGTPSSAQAMRETDELRLVDTDDFERDLAIGKLSARAACNCSQQLTALDRRLAALLRLSRISQDDNPLYPRTLFSAMLQALGDLDIHEQLALILLHEFERQTSVELPSIYADLNRYLVQAGVLPTIPLAGPIPPPRSETLERGDGGPNPYSGWAGFEPSEDSSLIMDQDPEPTVAASETAEPAAGVTRSPLLPNGDVFGQLARAIQAASRGRAGRVPQDAAKGRPSVAGTVSRGESPALGVAQLIQALNSLQRGFTDMRQIPGLTAVHIDPARGNVLQQIRATPMMMWSQPLDALTIDIVAMLFDAIFNDPELAATVRAEIAKLQIPVLKVALMDKTFFSDRRHPARRLIDVIAGSGIGRNENDEPRLIEKVRETVDAVVNGFDADINVFAVQTHALEDFLRDEDELARGKSSRVLDQLEQRDRQEIASTRVSHELETRLRTPDLPPLIAGFLSRQWRRVMTETFVRTGDAGVQWVEALATMDDLIWSVQPKDGVEDRSRLLAALPDLLKRLRRGLDGVHLEQAWDPFFDRLIRLHMAALHKEPPAGQAGADDQDDLAALDGDATDAGGSVETASEDEYLDLAKSLEVGTWVEFQSFRGTRKTLRLNWVSNYRGVYLFTNRQGDNALTLATTSLAGHLRKGTARVLSADHLTDRAVAQVLERVTPEEGEGLKVKVEG